MKYYLLNFLLLAGIVVQAQTHRFYYSNGPKFLKSTNDTMLYPFTGGMNCPQFSSMDLNNDNVKDLVVFDRSAYATGHKLLTFVWTVNKFIYAPQFEGAFPEMTDWLKLLDNDGDGKEDIFTEVSKEKEQLADTSKFPYTSGLRILKNISTPAGLKFKLLNNQILDTGRWYPTQSYPPSAVGVARNDIAGIADLDGDGDIDILGFSASSTSLAPYFYENFRINNKGLTFHPDTPRYLMRDECWGYILFDVGAIKNRFKLGQVKNATNCYMRYNKQQQKHAGSTLCILDLNGDGTKDMLYGDVSFNDLISLTNRKMQNSLLRDSIGSQDTLFPSGNTHFNHIAQPAAYYEDIDHDNVKELLVTTNNPTSVKSANNVWVYENSGTTASPVFNFQGNNFFINNETVDLGTRSVPVLVDIDKDGDKDLFVATNGDFEQTQNYNDRLVFYKNVGDSLKPVYMMADTNFLMLSKDTPVLNMHPAFGDLNGDGKPDMMIGDANGYLLYYVNQGSGTTYSFVLQSRKFADIYVRGYAAPQLVDLNKDGKLDLVIGNKHGIVQYYENTGTVSAPAFSATPTIDSLGGVFVNKIAKLPLGYIDSSITGYATPFVVDLNKDGVYEMIVGCEAGYLYLYNNVSATPGARFKRSEYLFTDSSYVFVSDTSSLNTYNLNFGARTAPFAGDADGDGFDDIMMGNMRGGLNFFSSRQVKLPGTGIGYAEVDVKRSVTIFPNPAQHYVQLTTENISEDLTFEVYNEIGQLLDEGRISRQEGTKKISTEAYTRGICFMVFRGASGYQSARRLVIIK